MSYLEVRNLRVFYNKAIALDGLNLRLKVRDLVGVIGPNGAGKTTLLRAISGMVPVEGEILFEEERIDRYRPQKIVRMGIIHCPERRQLFTDFTVLENLEMGAFHRSGKREIKEDLAYVFGLFPVLEERKYQLSGTLSGGEQQMLAIGRSLMSKPALLMLDEPSIGLSPMVKSVLAEAIKRIWEAGRTVLLVEQDANLTLGIVQRIYILDHGKAGFEGESQDLMNNEEIRKAYFQLG